MKKIILIITGVLVLLIVSVTVFTYFGLQRVSETDEYVTIEIKSGTSKFDIIDDLKAAGVIKSSLAAKIYMLANFNMNLQAGTYNINRFSTASQVLEQLESGDTNIYADTIKVTFPEGMRVTNYAYIISENFNYTYDEVIKVFTDTEYNESLIASYDFLTNEILDNDIYYPLEGYLFPNTYEFYEDATIEQIIEKLLLETANQISSLSTNIKESGYTLHELLTMASITELEAVETDDRKDVAQVIYSRLAYPMTLGMDVTTYYGVQKDMKELLNYSDLNDENGYNTRAANFLGLPVGPICNPSFESLTAVLNPSNKNNLYFIADVSNGKVHFFETYEEFLAKDAELQIKNAGLY